MDGFQPLPVVAELDQRPVVSEDWRQVKRWRWTPADEVEAAMLSTFFATADPGTVGELRFRVTETGLTTQTREVTGPTGSVRNQWVLLDFETTVANAGSTSVVLEVRRAAGVGGVRVLEGAATAAPAVLAYSAPRFRTLPAISGSAVPGGTLTLVPGEVDAYPTPLSYSVQWFLDGSPIAGATGPSIVVQPGWAGLSVSVQQTVINQVSATVSVSLPVTVGAAEGDGFGSSFGLEWGES